MKESLKVEIGREGKIVTATAVGLSVRATNPYDAIRNLMVSLEKKHAALEGAAQYNGLAEVAVQDMVLLRGIFKE